MKTVKEVEVIILKDGWFRVPSKSGHRQYKHPVKPGKVTISWHTSKDAVPPKTLKRIMAQAGLK